MQAIKQLAERYLGLPPAGPGQGTAWNFNYSTPWPSWTPDWGVLLVGLGLIAGVVWIYRRDAKAESPGMRFALIALRLAAIGLVLLFLTGVSLSVDRTGLPLVAVLVDDSGQHEPRGQLPGR